MNAEDILDQIEQDIAARLRGDTWFSQARQLPDQTWVSIPVITEQLGDLDTEVGKAVFQTSPGICLVVQALEWDMMYKNVPGPYVPIEPIEVNLLGVENVQFNRGSISVPSPTGTLKTIKATLLRAQSLLNGWTPPSLTRALVCGKASLLQRDKGIVQYNCGVTAAGGVFTALVQKVATPIVTIANGRASIACATIGACVCYTTDKSQPSPQRVSNIYTAPFPITGGSTLTVNAWLPYWVTSDKIQQVM
jgi:hypothetical protein